MMSVTTLSTQAGRRYRTTGLGMGLVSRLISVGTSATALAVFVRRMAMWRVGRRTPWRL